MKRVILPALLVMAVAAQGAAIKPRAVVSLTGRDGGARGTAVLATTPHGVLVTYEMTGLPPGVHAIHIQSVGTCDPAGGFVSAGPDFAPEARQHGFLNPQGAHAGDLPNGWAASDGTLRAATISKAFTLGKGVKSLFDTDGAALVIYARGDDYGTQPDGDAGPRIACGVIKREDAMPLRKGGRTRSHK